MYVAAVLSSLVDVDAAAIAFSKLSPGADDWRAPATAIAIAVVTNTVVKLGISLVMGAGRFRLYVTTALGVMAVAGGVTAVMVARF